MRQLSDKMMTIEETLESLYQITLLMATQSAKIFEENTDISYQSWLSQEIYQSSEEMSQTIKNYIHERFVKDVRDGKC
jgi:hypothetical protein